MDNNLCGLISVLFIALSEKVQIFVNCCVVVLSMYTIFHITVYFVAYSFNLLHMPLSSHHCPHFRLFLI